MITRIAPGLSTNSLRQHSTEHNQGATVYVGNLENKVRAMFVQLYVFSPNLCTFGEELLWELFVQAGPVVNVYGPEEKVTNAHQGCGFVELRSEEDADYMSLAFAFLSFKSSFYSEFLLLTVMDLMYPI